MSTTKTQNWYANCSRVCASKTCQRSLTKQHIKCSQADSLVLPYKNRFEKLETLLPLTAMTTNRLAHTLQTSWQTRLQCFVSSFLVHTTNLLTETTHTLGNQIAFLLPLQNSIYSILYLEYLALLS